MAERKLDIAVTAFNPTQEGTINFLGDGKAKNLDTKDFGQIVLETKFVRGNSVSEMNKNPNSYEKSK